MNGYPLHSPAKWPYGAKAINAKIEGQSAKKKRGGGQLIT